MEVEGEREREGVRERGKEVEGWKRQGEREGGEGKE